jgi:hypothetical protein
MRKLSALAAVMLLVCLSIPGYSQGGFFASVSGTVTDSSKALIPGVTVKATAVDTNVVTTAVTNEAGSYTFNNLNPGKYSITASLPGFQTKSITDATLSQNTAYRYNFELSVSGVNTQVEVSISADTILATSGASIGTVLGEQKVRDLPLVGNNVLNLITVLAGIENIAADNAVFGRTATTFAGVTADNISIVRDGIQVQDNRYPNGINSVTTLNPDLVGEIRLILTPVDVEIGRGNGTIQYSTRSGTNRFSGTAVWSFRNTALDPNSWTGNRNQAALVPGGPVGLPTPRNWNNINQGTVSFGGPIIKNKTFFFGLFDINSNRSRALATFPVLTPCARLGIFRYFNGWNNTNIYGTGPAPGSTIPSAATNLTSATAAAYPSVKPDGTPINPKDNGAVTNSGLPTAGLPPGWVAGTNYDATLQYISVFGKLASKPTAADCSDAPINMSTLVPNGVTVTAKGAPIAADGSNGWDLYRKQFETTGFLAKMLGFAPAPNNYEIGDGLNVAGYRTLRHFRGLDNLFGVGEGTGDRKQYNVKVDHNFSTNHKANVNVTYERVTSDDVAASYPGTFGNTNYRRPLVLSSGFTSTLSSTLLNEARFGMRRQGTNVVAPWDGAQSDEVRALFPPSLSGFPVIPNMTAFGVCVPYLGSRPPNGGCGITDTAVDKTPTYTYSDTLSWTRGSHALKFGGEFRDNSSAVHQTGPVFFGTPMYARPSTGSITGTGMGSSLATDIANTNPIMTYLLATNATNARTMTSWLAGSLNNLVHSYTLSSPDQINFQDPTKNTWTDIRTQEFFQSKIVQREFDAFFKDDYKLTKDLTLNLGVRWDYYGVPYLDSGLTNTGVGGGTPSAFGLAGSDFTSWMNPGIRGTLTTFEFVGHNSPNPNKTIYKNDFNNFSPGVGFAWNVPWLGEGRTTVRGGYQITYQGGGRLSTVQPLLAGAPGSTVNATPNWTNVYRDLASLTAADLPIPAPNLPLQPVPVGIRSATYSPFDSNFVNPYVQNLNLSVTRTVNRFVTVDLRYVGTLSKKNYTTTNLNAVNFLYNGLNEEFNRVRTGTELTTSAASPKSLLDKIFDGVNLCVASCAALPAGQTYGAVGTTTGTGANALYQSAAMQLRSSTQTAPGGATIQTNLANGNFSAVASWLGNLNYATTGTNAGLPPITAGTLGAVLRYANTKYPGQFPENFVFTNPQFSAVNVQTNSGYSNYHSLQVQTSIRPIHGMSGQFTYNWSKNLGVAGNFTNPVERALDYTNVNNNPSHSFRSNGTFELPIGPNKLLLGNSEGWLARAVERWQLGLIYNLTSGSPTSIGATSMLYANGVPDVVYPVDFNKLKGVRWGAQSGNFLEGRYFDNNELFVKVDDPQCGTVTANQGLSNIVNGVQTRCTLDALAMAVPAGTTGALDRVFADGQTRPSVIVLQHPEPGKRGTLGQNTLIGLGNYRFDANLGKTFRISESKSLQVRFDAQNVLNHPQPGNPSLSITGGDYFGRIQSKTGGRQMQGQLRLSF